MKFGNTLENPKCFKMFEKQQYPMTTGNFRVFLEIFPNITVGNFPSSAWEKFKQNTGFYLKVILDKIFFFKGKYRNYNTGKYVNMGMTGRYISYTSYFFTRYIS